MQMQIGFLLKNRVGSDQLAPDKRAWMGYND